MNEQQATKVVRKMLKDDGGECLIFRKHAEDRMLQRNINSNDVFNVLCGGKCTGAELHPKTFLWVYRFETSKYRVECNIDRSKQSITVITIMRAKGRLR